MALTLRVLIFLGMVIAVLFGSAGRWDLPFFWAFLGVVVVFLLFFRLLTDPGLQQERVGPGSGRSRSRAFRLALAPFVLGLLVVAGLDAGRFHWSAVPLGVQVAGLVGVAAALSLMLWAMAVNRFFSPAIYIQSERGHHVITGGPYRFIRHPGYLAMALIFGCGALALGSWWALLPVAGYALLILNRAAREDRFLQAELPGYADYAKRVHYRVLPGIWLTVALLPMPGSRWPATSR
jgi:protein-S-isoprenylcysteine O-methyltransferase Ste14